MLNKIPKWVVVLALLGLVIFGIRSCRHSRHSEKSRYTIGRVTTWYPFQLYGRERKFIGFTNDLFSAIGQECSLVFQWIETHPQSAIEDLEANHYDFIISSLRPTLVNEDHYTFSDLLFSLGPVLVVQKNSTIHSFEETNGRPIGIALGLLPTLKTLKQLKAENFDPLIVNYENTSRAFDALMNGQVDGVVVQAMEAYTSVNGLYAGKLKVVTPPLDDEGLRLLALRRSHLKDVIQEIDEAIETIKKNGTYKRLIAKWELMDPSTDYSVP